MKILFIVSIFAIHIVFLFWNIYYVFYGRIPTVSLIATLIGIGALMIWLPTLSMLFSDWTHERKRK